MKIKTLIDDDNHSGIKEQTNIKRVRSTPDLDIMVPIIAMIFVGILLFIVIPMTLVMNEVPENNNFNMTEIAVKMHYRSVAQLSSQFKSVTGLTPLHFKQLRNISFQNTAIN